MRTLIRERLAGFVTPVFRSPGGLWFADGVVLPRRNNVIAVLDGPAGRRAYGAANIVTDQGDLYYAERAVAATPTIDFAGGGTAGLRLGSGTTPAPAKADTDVITFIAATAKVISSTYPKVSDGDADNTGAGADIASWLYSYTKADFAATGINEGAIVDNTTTPTQALTHFFFSAAFEKTSNDSLKVFVNHEFLGS